MSRIQDECTTPVTRPMRCSFGIMSVINIGNGYTFKSGNCQNALASHETVCRKRKTGSRESYLPLKAENQLDIFISLKLPKILGNNYDNT